VFRKIARIFGSGGSRPEPSIKLAAFGKHPGWMDHMDELGLETDLLVALRRMLYSAGINQNIDGGVWSDQEPSHITPKFHHVFAWGVRDEVIVGRLWSSTDGRGRSLYPMIVCAHCSGMMVSQAFDLVLPHLERLEDQLVSTEAPDDVRAIIRRTGSELQMQAERQEGGTSEPKAALGQLADREELGPDREGLLRVLYEIDRDILASRTGSGDTWSSGSDMGRGSHLRVPCRGEDSIEVSMLWLEFLIDVIGGAAPVLVLLPLEYSWLDLIVGEASASQLSCLRATPERAPFTTTIPYSFDEGYLKRANRLIDESISRISKTTSESS
jgi:hypothetical protein